MKKEGYKTTEFWISSIVTLAGLVAAALPETHWAVKVAGLVISMGGAMGYTASRAKVKAGEAQ